MKILGVDIGGSGIKGAPVDTAAGLLLAERYRIATPKSGAPRAIAKALKKLVDHFEWKGGIGCGFPAVVQNGVAKTASNIDKKWIDTDAAQLFTEATNCKTYVVNDADAAGVAEMKFGAGRDQKGIVMIVTVGTGIGSAMFTAGKLVTNTELGHIYLTDVPFVLKKILTSNLLILVATMTFLQGKFFGKVTSADSKSFFPISRGSGICW
jgi:polyphosphate glucokinase